MKIHAFYFSPTGTSAKIVGAVADAASRVMGCELLIHDATFMPIASSDIDADDLAIVAAPVYGGKMAPIAKSRMHDVAGNGAGCVVIAVYGNRAFENAVCDMASFMEDKGFRVVGAGAFVGEHSYSTDATPIAVGRPDDRDLHEARIFGEAIGEKSCDGALTSIDVTKLTDELSPEQSLLNFRKFVMEYQKSQAEDPKVFLPVVDESLCDECGVCYSACPTEAIVPGSHSVDAAMCIKCCACVKSCPNDARSLATPFARPLSVNFSRRKSPRWL